MTLKEQLLRFCINLTSEEQVELLALLEDGKAMGRMRNVVKEVVGFISDSKQSRHQEPEYQRVNLPSRVEDKGFADPVPAKQNHAPISLEALFQDRAVFPTARDVGAAVKKDFGIDLSELIEKRKTRAVFARKATQAINALPDSVKRGGMHRLEDDLRDDSTLNGYTELFQFLAR